PRARGGAAPAAPAAHRLLDRQLELGLLVGAGDRPAAAAEQGAQQVVEVEPAHALLPHGRLRAAGPRAVPPEARAPGPPPVVGGPAPPPGRVPAARAPPGLGSAAAEAAEPGAGGLP